MKRLAWLLVCALLLAALAPSFAYAAAEGAEAIGTEAEPDEAEAAGEGDEPEPEPEEGESVPEREPVIELFIGCEPDPSAAEPAVSDAFDEGGEAVEPPTHRRVEVARVIGDVLHSGDEYSLVATLYGFEGSRYACKWQFDAGDGFQDAEGDGLILTVKATSESVRWVWRVLVTIQIED